MMEKTQKKSKKVKYSQSDYIEERITALETCIEKINVCFDNQIILNDNNLKTLNKIVKRILDIAEDVKELNKHVCKNKTGVK